MGREVCLRTCACFFLTAQRDCHLQSSPDQSSLSPASLTAYLQQGRLSSFQSNLLRKSLLPDSGQIPSVSTKGLLVFPLQATPPALENSAFLKLSLPAWNLDVLLPLHLSKLLLTLCCDLGSQMCVEFIQRFSVLCLILSGLGVTSEKIQVRDIFILLP